VKEEDNLGEEAEDRRIITFWKRSERKIGWRYGVGSFGSI